MGAPVVIDEDCIDITAHAEKTAPELIALLPEPPSERRRNDSGGTTALLAPKPPSRQQATGEVDTDEMTDLLLRATRNVIHAQDRERLYSYMCTLGQDEMVTFCSEGVKKYKDSFELSSTGKLFGLKYSRTGSTKMNELQLSKSVLHFGIAGKLCPMDKEMVEAVEFKCIKGKVKFSIEVPASCNDYTIEVVPRSGCIKVPTQVGKMKGNTTPPTVTVVVRLTLKTSKAVHMVLPVAVEDGPCHFIALGMQGEKSVFGAPLASLPLAQDEGHLVPVALKVLREHIRRAGYGTPALFRTAGDPDEIVRAKRQLNEEAPDLCDCSVHTLAHVIKLFYGSLPVPVLSMIPEQVILSCSATESLVQAFDEYVMGLNRDAVLWLLDMLVHVSAVKANKTSCKVISHNVGPALFDPLEGGSAEQVMRINQQRMKAVTTLLEWRRDSSSSGDLGGT